MSFFLFANRKGGISSGITPTDQGESAYTYMMPLVLAPAVLLLMRSGFRLRRFGFVTLSFICTVLFAAILIPAGQRLALLATITGICVYPMLRFKWRPSGLQVASGVTILFFLVVAMRDQGSKPSTTGPRAFVTSFTSAIQDPSLAWRTFTTSNDTEMFDALAIEAQLVPRQMRHRPGSSLFTFITHPIPRRFWPSKPYAIETYLNEVMLSQQGFKAGATSAGAAVSVLGGFYFDSGEYGVFIGMILLGAVFRAVWEYLQANPSNDMVRLVYSMALPLMIAVSRGSPQLILAYSLFTAVPIVVVAALASRGTSNKVARADWDELLTSTH